MRHMLLDAQRWNNKLWRIFHVGIHNLQHLRFPNTYFMFLLSISRCQKWRHRKKTNHKVFKKQFSAFSINFVLYTRNNNFNIQHTPIKMYDDVYLGKVLYRTWEKVCVPMHFALIATKKIFRIKKRFFIENFLTRCSVM
jgi:hypothetical protein